MTRLVVILPPLPLDRDFVDQPVFLTWPAYLAVAVARQAGLDVGMVDGLAVPGVGLRAAKGSVEGTGLWLGQDATSFADRLEQLDADAVLFTGSPYLVQSAGRAWLRRLFARLPTGRIGCRAVADLYTGGMHYLDYDGARLLAELPGLDVLLRYEGERLLRNLAEELRQGKAPAPGQRSENVDFPLDSLPAPAWDMIDAAAYFDFLHRVLTGPFRAAFMPPEPARTLPLQTARGCPFGCLFCTRNPGLPAPRRQVRAVPQGRVSEWLQDWTARFDLGRVVVLDEIANLDAERFDSLLETAERLELQLEFPNGLRADRLSDGQVERLRPLSAHLKVSLESASPRVQREVLEKHLDVGEVERVAVRCQQLGLPLQVHALIGLPGERPAEVLQTLAEMARLREEHGAESLIQYAVPLPGSDLASRLGAGSVPPAEDLPYGAFQQTPWPMPGAPEGGFLRTALAELRRRLAPGPKKLVVNLTYHCNNCCVFCAVGDRPVRHAARADVEEVLRAQRTAGTEMVDFDGGEPTLHPDLVPMVELARSLGYRPITLITNARRLSYPKFARRLVAAGLDQVLVSLHGPDATGHESLTRAPGSFAQTLDGLRACLDVVADAKRVAVNTTLVSDNLEALRGLGALLARMGVRRWNLQVLTPFGRAGAALRPPPARLTRVLDELLRDPPAGIQLQVINCPPCRLPGWEELACQDFAKRDRDMLFVGDGLSNLQSFLATRRRRLASCSDCPYSLTCAGDWVFPEASAGEGAA